MTTDNRYPAAYIRESMGEDTDDAKEGQRIDCRTLAQRDGQDPAALVEYDDWQRSGSESARRPAQEDLIAAIKSNAVSVVYARSMDRLMRTGAAATMAFLALAEAHGTRIVTLREGELSKSALDANPSTWVGFATIAMMAEYESRVGKARARSAVATKRRLGIAIGQSVYGTKPGEDVSVIVDAFRATGTYHGAVRKLTADGVLSRRGHLVGSKREGRTVSPGWTAEAVRRIIRREAPELIPVEPSRRGGKRTVQSWRFSRLLICPHDGTTLTTIPPNTPGGSVKYACRVGHRDGSHPRPYVISERYILPWAKAQMERRMKVTASRLTDDDIERSWTDLTAKRERVLDLFVEGRIDAAAKDKRLAVFDAELTELDALKRRRMTLEHGIDWDAAPGVVNARLREWWHHLELEYVSADTSAPMIGRNDRMRELDLRPKRAEWRKGPLVIPPPDDDVEVVHVIHERDSGDGAPPRAVSDERRVAPVPVRARSGPPRQAETVDAPE